MWDRIALTGTELTVTERFTERGEADLVCFVEYLHRSLQLHSGPCVNDDQGDAANATTYLSSPDETRPPVLEQLPKQSNSKVVRRLPPAEITSQ